MDNIFWKWEMRKSPLQCTHGLASRRKQNLHPWVKVDQAIRPLPPKTLRILVGSACKTDISV